VKLVGVNAESGKKLLFTVALIVVALSLSKVSRSLARGVTTRGERSAFWVRQAIHLATALVLVLGIASIWFTTRRVSRPPRVSSPRVSRLHCSA
jgi:hypothetical protein